MPAMTRFAAVLLAFIVSPCAADTLKPTAAGVLAGLTSVFRDGETGSVKVVADGQIYRLAMTQDGPTLLRSSGPVETDRPSDAIPHSRVVGGSNDIAQAWLAGPTNRYPHGVLGDDIEATSLRVRTRSGKVVTFELLEDSVFEDLTPRLVDIDGDGRDEILLVRAHRAAGASVVIVGLRGNRLVRLSESQAIGMANRWLNPIGVADFDGDGQNEVAVIETPHINGQLLLFKVDGRRLREVARYTGYSTHVIGSTELEMFAVMDVNGDGIVDIILPSQDRRELHVVTFAKGKLSIIATIKLFRPITTSIVAADLDRNGQADLIFGDQGGFVNVIKR